MNEIFFVKKKVNEISLLHKLPLKSSLGKGALVEMIRDGMRGRTEHQ